MVEKFVKTIDERITYLTTDAGKEWQGIPPLTEEYGFVWKRKNVTLTGHGAMARLDRDSEDTQVVHVSHLVVQRRRAD